ncbi:DNA polymerase/3'-5' exonuclease PolX [Heliorestis acidaminivorans]|uniref:DNA polymerase/3'-5' exonuclease PolX n=1 Tax=Heliorestis acidaminivorans TaxID=553427 RepID=A0A6I0F366_9FIRM|nr:DNA polymerase/3'-5' exonuclease PolX [Heliorestis acidaminivorans]KAB2951574.1 DNA polymerase/3'-5' exonuclease PolX [Heliorestis acidaminivorans]
MHNQEIAWALSEIADLMDIIGENSFKVRAFRQGALIVESIESPVTKLVARNQLSKIRGIGKGLCAEIESLVHYEKSQLLEKLRNEVPPGLLEILDLPNVGISSVRTFFKAGITTIEELEEMAKARKIRQLPGQGPKTELAILRGIEMIRRRSGKFPIGIAKSAAESFVHFLKNLPEVNRVELTGDLRRHEEMVQEIYILCTAEEESALLELLKKHPSATHILDEGAGYLRFRLTFGIPMHIEVTSEAEFIPRWVETTGTEAHWQALQDLRREQASHYNNPWQSYQTTEEAEENYYESLQLPWIAPELRDSGQEVEKAKQGKLPKLIKEQDIRGDLHIHTKWSDGVSSLEEMVMACQSRGYEYMAITDHSQSLHIARGLSEEQLLKQKKAIESLNKNSADFTVFSGVEMDILTDGRLDYPDEFIQEMDLVIASVHTSLRQERHKIHNRIEQALKNPHVDILAHPTGRLLGSRDPYDVDIDWLFDLAAKTGTVLEINASPERLDLSANLVKQAKERDILIAINTDAHDRARLGDIQYGINNARKAGLEKEDVLNCYSLKEVQKILNKPKSKRNSRS